MQRDRSIDKAIRPRRSRRRRGSRGEEYGNGLNPLGGLFLFLVLVILMAVTLLHRLDSCLLR
uniref:Uncharacterized protein n=1 Tax=Nelumbo nucifera TaxID=4432 RepID=A0A822ZDK2_NELNU|nr:TPA_asm: hypothetical protein HUJ06_000820 [Nelumbo nucifera]